jgi:hypothetical protein
LVLVDRAMFRHRLFGIEFKLCDSRQLEIDNNWIENGIRPTAIGKKNWLFIGGEATGQRSAIIYTLLECARRNRRRDRSRWRHRSLFRVRGERR